MNKDIASIRKDYVFKKLDETDLHPNPFQQFTQWWNEAIDAELDEPNAMTLGTVSPTGVPSCRIVLLKDYDDNGFTFFTNYNSDKGKDIANNPNVCLNFFWMDLQRQVKITGVASPCSDEVNDEYYMSRPRGSQIGAWASPQSQPIENRMVLEKLVCDAEGRFDDEFIYRPPFWGGYVVKPQSIEFWQGRQSRLHDRFLYTLSDGGWKVQRIAP